MLILMNEHLLARLNYSKLCTYDFSNTINFSEKQWEKMLVKIENLLSHNYNFLFVKLSGNVSSSKQYMIQGILSEELEKQPDDEKKFWHFKEVGTDYVKCSFTMFNAGYSYQYNGYLRTSDKSNKVSNRFNFIIALFTGGTFFYYIVDWRFGKYINLLNVNKERYLILENLGIKFINLIYLFATLIFNTTISVLGIYLLLEAVYFIIKKIDSK